MFDKKFESLEQETDPIKILRDSSFLLAVNQQLAVEISRRRKLAVDVAADELGMTYSLIAAKARLTKGRIGQIRKTAPPEERIVFGYGPLNEIRVTRLKPDPMRGVSINDVRVEGARRTFYQLLERLNLQVFEQVLQRSRLSHMYADSFTFIDLEKDFSLPEIIQKDPYIKIVRGGDSEERLELICDTEISKMNIIGYFGKFRVENKFLFILVGENDQALIRLVEYLSGNLKEIYGSVGSQEFSIILQSDYMEKNLDDKNIPVPINTVISIF